MKIYSNVITSADVRQAFTEARMYNDADIYIDDIRQFRPRDGHTYGVEVYANSNHGTRATGHRPVGSYDLSGEPRAASWTDYGYVMARLFNLDPDARISYYNGVANFVARCRAWVPRGQSTAFLDILNTPPCPACGSAEADCEPGCTAVPPREHMKEMQS